MKKLGVLSLIVLCIGLLSCLKANNGSGLAGVHFSELEGCDACDGRAQLEAKGNGGGDFNTGIQQISNGGDINGDIVISNLPYKLTLSYYCKNGGTTPCYQNKTPYEVTKAESQLGMFMSEFSLTYERTTFQRIISSGQFLNPESKENSDKHAVKFT